MKKRILIDATTVAKKTDGLAQYVINLLKNFPEESFTLYDLSILVNRKEKSLELEELISAGKFSIIEASVASIGPLRDIQMFYFWIKNKNKFDLFHSTSNQYPICIKNGIATIHDITFRKYFNESRWTFDIAKRYLDYVIKQSLKIAGSVIAVSSSTKEMLAEAYNLDEEMKNKITIIYEGWEHIISSEEDKGGTETDYGEYLFYVGSTRKHKNMGNLLKAFLMSLNKIPLNVKLILTGVDIYLEDEDIKTISLINKHEKRVIFTGYVSRDELIRLFRKATGFIFPSLSEGFGIPVLESFYFRKPLLCSDTSSLPEIAGDAAIYFNPEKSEDISKAIIYFFLHPEIVPELVAKGTKRLQLFSWKKAAVETTELYADHLAKYS